MNVCFIGFGNMAKAIAKSLTQSCDYQIFASAPSLQNAKTANNIITHFDNTAHLATADLVILAVKPNKMAAILQEIKALLPKNCLIISVAAGLNLAWLENHCYPEQAIVRAMPNIACQVGKGATPLIANYYVSEEQKDTAEQLFQCSGIVTWLREEADMDTFTALSGSGPAYVFLFMESMTNAAKNLGLEEKTALQFTLQTVAGALDLVLNTDLKPSELRKKVTSPAGTTAAAIDSLQQNKFEEIIFNAMRAAFDRAKQLGA